MPEQDNIIRPPFVTKTLEEERDKDNIKITLRLNRQEYLMMAEARKLLRQPKDSTALKQLAIIGFKCLTRPENVEIINIVFENDRKNKRLGIAEVE